MKRKLFKVLSAMILVAFLLVSNASIATPIDAADKEIQVNEADNIQNNYINAPTSTVTNTDEVIKSKISENESSLNQSKSNEMKLQGAETTKTFLSESNSTVKQDKSFEIKPENTIPAVSQNKRIIVKYKNENGIEEVKNNVKNKLSLKKLETKNKIKNSKMDVLEIDDTDDIGKTVKEIKKDPNVLYAQPDFYLSINNIPTDQNFPQQWSMMNTGQTIAGHAGSTGIDISAVEAHNITYGKASVVVGVLDSGIDTNHSDLKSNIYSNANGTTDNYDFYNDDTTVYDDQTLDQHGTMVGGIIAATANKEGVRGVAPGVSIVSLKFISGNTGSTSDAINAIEYAKSKNIKILNCSFGGEDDNPALKEAMANSGILFICAAGNNGMNTSTKKIYPAAFGLPNIISVAAIDNTGNIASFSNYGMQVDVVAPGKNILTTVPENQYMYMNGTSAATPHITGIAALMMSQNPNLTPSEIKSQIEQTVTPVSLLTGKVKTGGVANAYKALGGGEYNIIENRQTYKTIMENMQGTTVEQNEIVTDVPFKLTSSLNSNNSIDTTLSYSNATYSNQNIQIEISEVGQKEIIASLAINAATQSAIIQNLVPDKRYIYTVKCQNGNEENLYNGQFIIRVKIDSQTHNNLDVNLLNEVYANPFKATTQNQTNASDLGILAIKYEGEANGTQPTANLIDANDDIYGKISEASDSDYYKVVFSDNGYLNLWLGEIPLAEDYDLYLLDNAGSLVASSQKNNQTDNTELITEFQVEKNKTYYIKIVGYNGSYDTNNYYHLRTRMQGIISGVNEPNDTQQTAIVLQSTTSTVYSNITNVFDEDCYKITIPDISYINLSLENPIGTDYIPMFLGDDGAYYAIPPLPVGAGYVYHSEATVKAGTYYIKIWSFSGCSENNYKLDIKCTPVSNMFGVTVEKDPVNNTQYNVYVKPTELLFPNINKYSFETWTSSNGKDDLNSNWEQTCTGTYNTTANRWEYTVNTSDHNNEYGEYNIQAYAYVQLPDVWSPTTGMIMQGETRTLLDILNFVVNDPTSNTVLTASVMVANDIVTVTGTTSAGVNKMVTLLTTNQAGNIVYIDQKESGTGGEYSFTFTMPSTATIGIYTVKVGGEGITVPISKIFDYTKEVIPTTETVKVAITVVNDIVTVTGITNAGANKMVTLLATNQAENIIYIDQKESGIGGQYSFVFKMPNTADSGTYKLKVGGEGITAPTTKTFDYVKTVIPTTETVTANITLATDMVTVTGVTSVGANKMVTLLATNQDGNIIYIDQKESGTGGQYSFTFKMASTTTTGTYTVKVGGEGITAPTTKTFDYVKTGTIVPTTPTNLTASNIKSTTVDLSWTASTDNVGYEVYKNDAKIDIPLLIENSYTVTGLTPNTIYTFKVRAKDASGNVSEYSSAISCKTESIYNKIDIPITTDEDKVAQRIILTADNVQNISSKVFTVTYCTDEFQIVDICGFTYKKELVVDIIIGSEIYGTGIIITNIVNFTDNGKNYCTIEYKANKVVLEGYSWSGITNSIIFMPKITGSLSIEYNMD